ncbi:cohesin domain-containing protein [Candidatus Parcubacteria bacterium]|nr:cohesin domain-containing protein [Candidatus Parcubacteria bacterium]
MRKLGLSLVILLTALSTPHRTQAQTIRLDASMLQSTLEIYFSPKSGSFVEGSTFDMPILVNTKGISINGVEVRVTFDKNRLEIVKPSSGNSIIGVWIEPPGFDNTKGTASYVGVIPNGIVTNSGLVGTITFRVKSTGSALVSLTSNSKILLNDGLGTEARVELGRAQYSLIPKAPEGVRIYSDTHPFQDEWYKNNNPVISWDKDPGVEGFSAVFDNTPNTEPENKINTTDTSQSFENLADGLWYFHIKAIKAHVWSTTGHFLVRIDTSPPADFKPTVNFLLAAAALSERALVSFFTTDNLSGVDHYEIGTIDKSQPTTVSPVFVNADPPFQVPLTNSSKLHAIVRAVDKAGNIRDAGVDIEIPSLYSSFFKDNLVYILLIIILAGILGWIIHLLFGHHIVRHMRRALQIVKKEEEQGIEM